MILLPQGQYHDLRHARDKNVNVEKSVMVCFINYIGELLTGEYICSTNRVKF